MLLHSEVETISVLFHVFLSKLRCVLYVETAKWEQPHSGQLVMFQTNNLSKAHHRPFWKKTHSLIEVFKALFQCKLEIGSIIYIYYIFVGLTVFCACFNHISQPGDPCNHFKLAALWRTREKDVFLFNKNGSSIKKPQKMSSLRRQILMLQFLHSYPCLAMPSVTKCAQIKCGYLDSNRHTVDGSEIRVTSWGWFLYRALYYPRWCRISSINSIVKVRLPRAVMISAVNYLWTLRMLKPSYGEEYVLHVLRCSTFFGIFPHGPGYLKLKIWDFFKRQKPWI